MVWAGKKKQKTDMISYKNAKKKKYSGVINKQMNHKTSINFNMKFAKMMYQVFSRFLFLGFPEGLRDCNE